MPSNFVFESLLRFKDFWMPMETMGQVMLFSFEELSLFSGLNTKQQVL